MQIKEVHIAAFRSFRLPTRWTWPEGNGLFLVSGDNQVDPQLGGNAAGKSSLFEALVWCLYGKTARGLRGKDVVPWGAESAGVTVTMVRLGHTYRIERTVAPNSLRLNGRVVEQEAVTQALGVNYECFLFSAVMGQFNRYFFDLGAADKLNLFSFVLDLDAWVDRSARAKLDLDFVEGAIAKGEAILAGLHGRQEEIAVHLASLEASTREWEAARAVAAVDLQDEAAENATQAATLARVGVRLAGKVSFAKTEALALERELAAHGASDRKLRAELDRLRMKVRAIAHDVQVLHGEARDVEDAAPFCRACRQEVSKGHVRREMAVIRGKARSLRGKKKALKVKIEEIQEEIAQEDMVRGEVEVSAMQARDNESHLRSRLDRHTAQVEEVKARAREIERKQTALEMGSNPHQIQYDLAMEKLHEVAARQRRHSDELLTLRLRASRSRYWHKGFRELRLWLIDEVLRELEIETNNALTSLGLDGWEVTYEIERETKAGGVARGFHVFVLPPGASEPVKWESYSGGETQRLRVAGALGVANLIARRRGVELGWEVWDEPTAHINAAGVDDLLQFFRDRARLEDKQIWFVDHHALDLGCFDGTFRVVKDEDGSHLRLSV